MELDNSEKTEPFEPDATAPAAPEPSLLDPILQAGGMETTEPEATEELEEEKQGRGGLLGMLGKSSPYTFLLFIAVVAMVMAILCLYAEYQHYGGDTKAQGAKHLVSVAAPRDLGAQTRA